MGGGPSSEGGLGREIVLALVVEQPGTAYRIEALLSRRFRYGYTSGHARKALERLCESGLVVAVSDPGEGVVVYRPTDAGVARRLAWLAERAPESVMREELHAKILACTCPAELEPLLETVEAAQLMCERMQAALEKRSENTRRSHTRSSWLSLREVLAEGTEEEYWASRLQWLTGTRARIERLLAEMPCA